jgi:glycosyltransferase involved in cell wall biosynthesis
MPAVSIIITTHNRPHLVVRAVESARAASRNEVEIVVVDDASKDETAQVCRSIVDINYVRAERNQGVAGARNLGILQSSGEYLSFLDDDDVRLTGSLEAQVEALASVPEAAFIYGQAILGRQDGSMTEQFYPAQAPQGDVFWELLTHNFVPAGATVFRRSCLYRVGLLDDAIPGVDDWDLWVRLAEVYPVLALEQPVMVWRQAAPNSGQGSSRAIDMVKCGCTQFRGRWLKLPRAAQASPTRRLKSWDMFSDRMARHLFWEAWRTASVGKIWQAQKMLLAAMRYCPKAAARVLIQPASLPLLLTHARRERQAIRSAKQLYPESVSRNRQ